MISNKTELEKCKSNGAKWVGCGFVQGIGLGILFGVWSAVDLETAGFFALVFAVGGCVLGLLI